MTPPRIMFARTGGIGNALAAVPALRAIKHAWPDSRITLVIEAAPAKALENCPYVDETLIYEKRGADSGVMGYLRFLTKLREQRFTHAILSKRFLRMSLLARLAGARVRVGFAGYGHGITHPVEWDAYRSVIKTNLDLVAALGIEPQGYHLEIWPSDEDAESAETFLEENDIAGHPFIVTIHPGGISQRGYLWPIGNYIELAKALAQKYDAAPIFIGGAPDAQLLDKVRESAGNSFPISDKLSILGTAHLISKSRMFVGSDSAPSHFAVAVGTPSVIYYGSKPDYEENLARWSPLSGNVVSVSTLPGGDHPSVEMMMERVEVLMDKMEKTEPDKN